MIKRLLKVDVQPNQTVVSMKIKRVPARKQALPLRFKRKARIGIDNTDDQC